MGSITGGGSRLSFFMFFCMFDLFTTFLFISWRLIYFSFIFLGKFTYFITYNFTM